MSTTDIIKPQLNHIYGQADWKRLSKSRINSEWELREFKEPESGIVVSAFTHVETQHTQLYNGSKIIFGITQSENKLIIRIAEPFYQRLGESNEGIEKILPLIGKELPAYLRDAEDGECVCDVGLHSRDQLVADMISAGFTFDIFLANDINEEYGGPVYGHVALGQAMANRLSTDDEEDADEERWKKAKGNLMFGVYWDSKHIYDGSMAVSFVEPSHWAKEQCLESIHVEDILTSMGYVMPKYISGEDMENVFTIWEDGMDLQHLAPINVTKQQVIDDFTAMGIKFSQELDDFLNQ